MRKDPFKEYDDPDYWDEGDSDRRDGLAVLVSYKDVKFLSSYLGNPLIEKLLKNMDYWDDSIRDVLS